MEQGVKLRNITYKHRLKQVSVISNNKTDSYV